MSKINKIFSFVLALSLYSPVAMACTRVVYNGENNIVVTGRTMDWKEDQNTNMWIFPRGIKRDGLAGKNSIKWTSKYGSVVTSAYDISSPDGMNEKGLVANLLFLTESQFVNPKSGDRRKKLAISMWAQYFLDNYATVDDAVKDMIKEKFYVVPTNIPGEDRQAGMHLALSDSTGDSAIFEYIDGKLKIYHNKEYHVVTNSPEYSQQLAITGYWQSIGGTVFLPGTNRAADRFARASFYLEAVPKTDNDMLAIFTTLSIIRNVSVPIGISTPDQPNISTTIWRTIFDHKNKKYFFESTTDGNLFWVNLNNINFNEKQPIKKLSLTNNSYYSGDASDKFKDSDGLNFLSSL